MNNLPFYITLEGKNVISKQEIKEFYYNNPELNDFSKDYTIELRLLKMDLLESFCSWIISQQISSHAASKILNRFKGKIQPLTPQIILQSSIQELRNFGLSRPKAQYIHNVANFILGKKYIEYPENYTSEQIRRYYTTIKGIGIWTVNMHLIFIMGRKDILAIKDLVVRKGIKELYDLSSIPNEKQARIICKNWGKLATLGSLLAWEVSEKSNTKFINL